MRLIPNSVAERYCVLHGIPPEDFIPHIRRKVLHPHARFIVPVIVLFKSNYLVPDNDFIDDVGQITHYSEFSASVAEYFYHPANIGILRQRLLVRVSSERMRRLVKQILGMIHSDKEATEKTKFPFVTGIKERSDPAESPQSS